MDEREWLSTGDAARIVGASQQSIRRWAKEGRLAYLDTAVGYLIRREDAERLAKQWAAREDYWAARSRRVAAG